MGILTVKLPRCCKFQNIDDAWRLIMPKIKKKTGLTSRNWTDSSNSLDERQIKFVEAASRVYFPLPDLSDRKRLCSPVTEYLKILIFFN